MPTQSDFLLRRARLYSDLEPLAQRYSVTRYFRHSGMLPFEQMGKALSYADIFVMPYSDRVANRGRWPGRIGTYLALGRPIVSNPVGEIKLLFENEAVGLLAMKRCRRSY